MSKIIKIENDCPAWCPHLKSNAGHDGYTHRIFGSNLLCTSIGHYSPRSLSTTDDERCTTKFIFKRHCRLKVIQI